MISWFLNKFIYPVVNMFFPHGIQGENHPDSWKQENEDVDNGTGTSL